MFQKAKTFFHEKRNQMAVAIGGSLGAVGGLCTAFAEGPTTTAPSTADITGGVTTVTNAVTSAFNISTIAEIIGIVLAGCVGLFLFWWGARKVVRMISAAFKKGKISL